MHSPITSSWPTATLGRSCGHEITQRSAHSPACTLLPYWDTRLCRGYSVITKDVLPYSKTVSERYTHVFGVNTIGLERRFLHPSRSPASRRLSGCCCKSKLKHQPGRRGDPKENPIGGSRGPAGFHRGIATWRHQVDTVLLAGNGKFPFLVLEAARSQGIDMVVAAIKEETFRRSNSTRRPFIGFRLGHLEKLIKTFQVGGCRSRVMAGQVRHKQIFSSIGAGSPD